MPNQSNQTFKKKRKTKEEKEKYLKNLMEAGSIIAAKSKDERINKEIKKLANY